MSESGLRVISQTAEEWRSQLRSEYPWIRLFAFRRPDGQWYRLARYDSIVNYGKTSGGADVKWYPYDVNFDRIENSDEGNLAEFRITINNAAREVSQALDQYDFTGEPARFLMVHALELDVPNSAVIDQSGKIANVEWSGAATVVNVSVANLYDYYLPSRIYSRTICSKLYGGPECLIDKGVTGMPQTCGRSLTDCETRGDVEVAEGLPRLHPLLYGGFPGTQSQ